MAVPFGMKHRVGLALLQRDRGVQDLDCKLAVAGNMQVGHVAGMSLTGQHPMLVAGRIEMPARRFEWRLALADGMDVKGAFARRHALERDLEQNPALGLHKLYRPNVFSLRVLERRARRLRRLRQRREGSSRPPAGWQPRSIALAETLHGIISPCWLSGSRAETTPPIKPGGRCVVPPRDMLSGRRRRCTIVAVLKVPHERAGTSPAVLYLARNYVPPEGSCVTSIAGPHGDAQLNER